ncbi:hypothetical protein J6590_068025 [Homalodisca vitripennis]|nr:hypothetical protein J6590_068025 [Homalodisca vitripennis]
MNTVQSGQEKPVQMVVFKSGPDMPPASPHSGLKSDDKYDTRLRAAAFQRLQISAVVLLCSVIVSAP